MPDRGSGAIHTDIPARLDRLPGSRFHWLIVGAALMLFAALVAARFAVNAERASLERVAPPLSVNQPPL